MQYTLLLDLKRVVFAALVLTMSLWNGRKEKGFSVCRGVGYEKNRKRQIKVENLSPSFSFIFFHLLFLRAFMKCSDVTFAFILRGMCTRNTKEILDFFDVSIVRFNSTIRINLNTRGVKRHTSIIYVFFSLVCFVEFYMYALWCIIYFHGMSSLTVCVKWIDEILTIFNKVLGVVWLSWLAKTSLKPLHW